MFPSEQERFSIDDVARGIVFVHAVWSGPSFASAAALLERLARIADPGTLTLVVLDIDSLPDTFWQRVHTDLMFPVGGNGETLFVRGGRVIGAWWTRDFRALSTERVTTSAGAESRTAGRVASLREHEAVLDALVTAITRRTAD